MVDIHIVVGRRIQKSGDFPFSQFRIVGAVSQGFHQIFILTKLEKGHPGVSIEMFLLALMVLDKLDELVAVIEDDPLGIVLMDESLPQRIRIKK